MKSSFFLSSTLSVLLVAAQSCRNIPGDAGWPSLATWNQFNQTINGRLIATVPQASVCHDPTFNALACETLQAPFPFTGSPPELITRLGLNITQWDNGANYIDKPAEIINAYYQNQTCDPFTSTQRPCKLGNMAVYSINVTAKDDVIAAMDFAKTNNIRLTVRNTGHDYNGKSSGQGSLSLWTHNLQDIDVIPEYNSNFYNGPAIKAGAGINGGPYVEAAGRAGYQVVAGECATVGIAGGYTQGGGHSPLNSAYGMSADQVLEWEVVTGEGEYLVATPEQNQDLYWALSGGGGGTYGVTLSMTVRAHKETTVTASTLSLAASDNDTFWKGVGVFHKHLPGIIKGTNHSAQYIIEWNSLYGDFVFLDQDDATVNATLAPLLQELSEVHIQYNYSLSYADSYLHFFNRSYGPLPYGWQPPSTLLDSRLIPESVVTDEDANQKLVSAFRLTTDPGDFSFGCTALDVSNAHHPDNAVLPAWRDAIALCIIEAFWDFTAPLSHNIATKDRMNTVYQQAMDDATPGSGVYLNEIDSGYLGDFKTNMYGANYDRLLEIKHQRDPNNFFFGHHAVGSDEFVYDSAGRLCHVAT